MHILELRRQIFHALYGPAIIILHNMGILNLSILVGMIIGGAVTSYMIKQQRMSHVRRLLAFFERDHHLEQFPGRGILFFTIGATLCLALFTASIAYAGILILSFGDAASNIAGRHLGFMKTMLNPNKNIEGTLVGILVSIPAAYFFVPNLMAAIAASCIAMFLEIPNIRIGNFEIDDNLLIPLGASFTLSLFV